MTGYPRFRPFFASALDPRLYTIAHLDALIASHLAQLWPGEHAAIVTEVRDYPAGARVVHGLVAAIDPAAPPGAGLDEIVGRLIPRAEAWARAVGCAMAVIESRPGWARALAARGYAPHQLAVRKALGPVDGGGGAAEV